MKNLRLGTILVFALFACWLPAQAQTWTYTGNNGAEQVYINITQYSNGYGVSGAVTGGGLNCSIRGTYYPNSGQIRGRCIEQDGFEYNLDGARRAGQDVFQLTRPLTIVLRRAGAARASRCDVSGRWWHSTRGLPKTPLNFVLQNNGSYWVQEEGLASVRGPASFDGQTITWKFTLNNREYTSVWRLNANCTASVSGTHGGTPSTLTRR